MGEAGGGGGVWNADTLISEGQSETSQDRQIAGTDDLKKKKREKLAGGKRDAGKGQNSRKDRAR